MRQLKITKSITNRENDGLQRYLVEIAKLDLISFDEEKTLAEQIRAGDEKAFQKLVKANLRFVVSVAKQYQNQGLSLQDLINEGNQGLIKAARRFDETKGFRFISFAVWWIRQTILLAVAEQGSIIRKPQNKVNLIKKIHRKINEIEQRTGLEFVDNEQIAEELGISEYEVSLLRNIDQRTIHLDQPLNLHGEGGEDTVGDMLQDGEADFSLKLFDRESFHTDLKFLSKQLSPKEYDILIMYYGIGRAPLDGEEIGRIFGVQKSRVQQIRDRALKKLQKPKNATLLKKYLNGL